ncbi:pectin lyase-like protein [Roridomyces roridus]|uniref:galacturonan 1,4-alpha-galacturonidase n=1 Tax=Roridomyces roridus TaxID=1738132 RepID=A0AAD7C8S9_9AGAR|nr:pectin lyase-like protein [Roridomyces roridus]
MLLLSLITLVSVAFAWDTLTVPHTPGQDDTPGLLALVTSHPSNATILFSQGTTYNIFSAIKFPALTNVEISIQGNLTYPEDIGAIQDVVAASSFPGSWFTFSGGNNVTLRGSTDPEWGWIDAHGQAWWDADQQVNRPHGIAFSKITNGVIRDMKIWKPIGWNFATSGTNNVHIFNNLIMAVSDNSSSFPFNTDGFSAGGTNLLFENNVVFNGDDCLTVGSGAVNITWRNGYCEGGHGLSIGSLGENGAVANVQNVLMETTVMNHSLYAARFKSWTGGNGAARNVTWKDITFNDVAFPIYVTQNYWDQEVGPQPNVTGTPNNTHIEDFLFQGFSGSIRDIPFVEGSCVTDPCWYFVPNATGREVAILDLYPGTAMNVLAKDIEARTETGRPVDVMCNATAVSNDVGFQCVDGPFVRTKAGL